ETETITHKGADYTLVDRKAQPGDVVVFTETGGQILRANKPYEVLEGMYVQGERKTEVYKEWLRRTEANTLVYAPVEQPKPTTGDIVVITANTNDSRNEVGDIGKVGSTLMLEYGRNVDVPGKTKGNGNFTKLSEMRLATPAEIEQYERAVAKAEFKTGDYAKVISTGYNTNAENGEIVKITKVDSSGVPYCISSILGKSLGWAPANHLEKVTEEERKFAEIGRKPNEYKEGDIVRGSGNLTAGEFVGIVEDVDRTPKSVGIRLFDKDYKSIKVTELIAPVESRVDVK